MKNIPYPDIATRLQKEFPEEKEIKSDRCGQIAREYAKKHKRPSPALRKKTK